MKFKKTFCCYYFKLEKLTVQLGGMGRPQKTGYYRVHLEAKATI